VIKAQQRMAEALAKPAPAMEWAEASLTARSDFSPQAGRRLPGRVAGQRESRKEGCGQVGTDRSRAGDGMEKGRKQGERSTEDGFKPKLLTRVHHKLRGTVPGLEWSSPWGR